MNDTSSCSKRWGRLLFWHLCPLQISMSAYLFNLALTLQAATVSPRLRRSHYHTGVMTSTSIITLNVGGQLFMTSLQTLTADPSSYFTRRSAGEFPAHTMPDGSHFIDRSPQHFQKVLDYLRNGYCVLPSQAE